MSKDELVVLLGTLDRGEAVDACREYLKSCGYYVSCLWGIDDVQGGWECDDDEAQEVLDKVMRSEWIFQQTWETIADVCEHEGYKKITDEE